MPTPDFTVPGFIVLDVVSLALGIWPALSGFSAAPFGWPLVSAAAAGLPVVACAKAGPASITPATASATVIFQLAISDLLKHPRRSVAAFRGQELTLYRE